MTTAEKIQRALSWAKEQTTDDLTAYQYVIIAEAALDTLEAEHALLKEELRLREESQIPMIPRAVAERLAACEKQNIVREYFKTP